MPRARKYPNPVSRTLYIDKEVYFKMKKLAVEKLGKGLSELVNEYFIELISKLEGSGEDVQGRIRYEGVKREYVKLVDEVRRLTVSLYRAGVYERLKALALECGLDFKELSNLSEVSPKLLDAWDGRPEHMHLFISLLEAGQRKKRLEKKLAEIRRSQHFSVGVNLDGEAKPETDAVQEPRGLPQMRSDGTRENS